MTDPLPDVDPLTAPVGERFVIQQHHATALHHDFRLEMLNDEGPVLVSWAVPKRLPRSRGQRHLAIRTPDHAMEHLDYAGTIPDDEYGGGVVRIFDRGRFEMLGRTSDRITFRLDGERLIGVWHLIHTGVEKGKEQWLALMSEDLRPPGDPRPQAGSMRAVPGDEPFDDPEWGFEPMLAGGRVFAVWGPELEFVGSEADHPELARISDQVIAVDAMLDGVIVAVEGSVTLVAFDVLWIDGRDLTGEPYRQRRSSLEEAVVPSDRLQVIPMVTGQGRSLFAAVAEQGLSGIMAKRLQSTYEPGGRSEDWLSIVGRPS